MAVVEGMAASHFDSLPGLALTPELPLSLRQTTFVLDASLALVDPASLGLGDAPAVRFCLGHHLGEVVAARALLAASVADNLLCVSVALYHSKSPNKSM